MKCLDCDMMICREYYMKKDVWKGYCQRLRLKVYGNDVCYTEAKNKYKSIIEVIYFACNGLFYFL